MRSVVDDALRSTQNQALEAYNRANLLGRDIWTLKDSWELDYNIINIYFILIERCSRQPDYPSIYLYNVHFYDGLGNRHDD